MVMIWGKWVSLGRVLYRLLFIEPSIEAVFGRGSLRVVWMGIDILKPGFGWILVMPR